MDRLHTRGLAGPQHLDKLRSLNKAAESANTQQPAESNEDNSQNQPSAPTLQSVDRQTLRWRRRTCENLRPSDQKRGTLAHGLVRLGDRQQASFGFPSVQPNFESGHEVSPKNAHDDRYGYEEEPARLCMFLDLPFELQCQIIVQLPVPAILNLRLVSKSLHHLVTQNETPIAIYQISHSVPAYALRLYPVPDRSLVTLHYLCGLWHRLHVAQKLSVHTSEHIIKENYLQDRDAKLIDFLPQLIRIRRRLMPLIFVMFHFFEKYRELHLKHLEAHGVPLRFKSFNINPIEKQVIDIYDDDLLLAVHQVFPLVLDSFSWLLRLPSYVFHRGNFIEGRKHKLGHEVNASILMIGGLRQVERLWEIENYHIRHAAVNQWNELLNHDRESGKEWDLISPNGVGKCRTTANPIYNTSLAMGPPMKPLPHDQLRLLRFDQLPWPSIWSQTAETIILKRKIVYDLREIKNKRQILMELIREDVTDIIEDWSPGLSQASRWALPVQDLDDFRGPSEVGTIARLDLGRESWGLRPPPSTADAGVVEQNTQASASSTQPPDTIESDVTEVSNYLQNTAAGAETEPAVLTQSAEQFKHLHGGNFTKEKDVVPRIKIATDFKDMNEALDGPQNPNTVPSISADSAKDFILTTVIYYGYMITRAIASVLLAVQRFVGEPDIPEGMERVRWRCSCGSSMYDDFAEQQLGAVKRLERSLNLNYESSRKGDYRSSAITKLLATLGKSLSKSSQSLRQVISIPSEGPGLRQEEAQSSSGNQWPDDEEAMPVDALWLLLCVSEGGYATKLLQLKLCKNNSDQKLFSALRAEYIGMRGRWFSFISFRTLKHIKFVQFEMYEGRPEGQLIEVRKAVNIPPFWDSDYCYSPAPADVIPPVGKNHLMHLFQHPLHAQSKRVCFDRLPKKRRDPLVCAGQSVQLGWGLHFVEGWSVKKIWLSGFLISGAGSLAFGISWVVFEHRIQDAFAVAGYCLTLGTFSIGTLQAVLYLN